MRLHTAHWTAEAVGGRQLGVTWPCTSVHLTPNIVVSHSFLPSDRHKWLSFYPETSVLSCCSNYSSLQSAWLTDLTIDKVMAVRRCEEVWEMGQCSGKLGGPGDVLGSTAWARQVLTGYQKKRRGDLTQSSSGKLLQGNFHFRNNKVLQLFIWTHRNFLRWSRRTA